MTRTSRAAAPEREALLDAFVTASRTMVALAARSLAGLDADVTLPQYRVLVVLAQRGPQRVVAIATELGVNPSTGTRMCDRLVRKGLAQRHRSATDRREVRVTLTPAGYHLVTEVTARRRAELESVVDDFPQAWLSPLTGGLLRLADLSGEVPEGRWWAGTAPAGPR